MTKSFTNQSQSEERSYGLILSSSTHHKIKNLSVWTFLFSLNYFKIWGKLQMVFFIMAVKAKQNNIETQMKPLLKHNQAASHNIADIESLVDHCIFPSQLVLVMK